MSLLDLARFAEIVVLHSHSICVEMIEYSVSDFLNMEKTVTETTKDGTPCHTNWYNKPPHPRAAITDQVVK